jgi:hypothetical protein
MSKAKLIESMNDLEEAERTERLFRREAEAWCPARLFSDSWFEHEVQTAADAMRY